MPYLGNTPTQQAFTPAVDFFSGNGSTTAFTLSRAVASVAQVEAVIENVVQSPNDAYTISGNTITFTSAPPTGSNNIYVRYTSPITQVIQPSNNTVGTAQLTSDLQNTTYGMKNRIINGAMMIDQRNAGAAISAAGGGYAVDRWQMQYSTGTLTLQQSSQAPSGFVNSLCITVTSAGTRLATDYFLLNQKIEGYNFADLNFGSSSAATVTVSFWVRSSVTGTFSGVLASGDNARTYPFNYTINSANTWEQKSVTITGDTSGGTTAYPTTNGIGAFVKFDLGSGSNYEVASAGSWQVSSNKIGTTSQVGFAQTGSATFYITGVQLEKGTTATSFDFRSYGTELALCQRYYQTTGNGSNPTNNYAGFSGVVLGASTGFAQGLATFKVSMRAAPSVVLYDGTGASGKVTQTTIADGIAATVNAISQQGFLEIARTTGTFSSTLGAPITAGYTASAEL